DYNGATVTQYNKTMPNWSASASLAYGVEIKSMDDAPEVPAQDFIQTYTSKADISARKSLRFNNYQGFSRQVGFNVGVKGYGNLGMTQSADGITFSASVDLAGILQRGSARFAKETDNSPAAAADKALEKYLKNKIGTFVKSGINANFGST